MKWYHPPGTEKRRVIRDSLKFSIFTNYECKSLTLQIKIATGLSDQCGIKPGDYLLLSYGEGRDAVLSVDKHKSDKARKFTDNGIRGRYVRYLMKPDMEDRWTSHWHPNTPLEVVKTDASKRELHFLTPLWQEVAA
jgi:hypothetical protein